MHRERISWWQIFHDTRRYRPYARLFWNLPRPFPGDDEKFVWTYCTRKWASCGCKIAKDIRQAMTNNDDDVRLNGPGATFTEEQFWHIHGEAKLMVKDMTKEQRVARILELQEHIKVLRIHEQAIYQTINEDEDDPEVDSAGEALNAETKKDKDKRKMAEGLLKMLPNLGSIENAIAFLEKQQKNMQGS